MLLVCTIALIGCPLTLIFSNSCHYRHHSSNNYDDDPACDGSASSPIGTVFSGGVGGDDIGGDGGIGGVRISVDNRAVGNEGKVCSVKDARTVRVVCSKSDDTSDYGVSVRVARAHRILDLE
ncbi:hypothetical protein BC936DRAFT_137625 [Jimgerdemannia flammicorona]|uniref:Uncharacterized protein n=1 Tax=Jimgerdemannia flammicorona TaxID=994334 RepID=A0A433DND8_9FUNG|nr:hypothetical protein BC936DRAFT_137625 [Jimgerdemannia flammicorona]